MVNPNIPRGGRVIGHLRLMCGGKPELRSFYHLGGQTYMVESVDGSITCPVSRDCVARTLGITRQEILHRLESHQEPPCPWDEQRVNLF